ncbi:helix-turn-helix domain-containing protein [Halobacillus litoralis]|uniref:helix-turn-helix domain-containing protein n=1 Tax=Halobacillus litoralis TaxID=45668 RepID=UPI001CD2CCDD|nr:helix-turn-helix transcriptional regulator [Halobacillus litoralis]MCA0972263.1 helix-turn-helix domain-containing protein [Halobacillus litoralis]
MEISYDQKIRRVVGDQIRHVRKSKEISQEELAFRAGIDRTYISFIERGIRSPRLPVLYRIAHALKVSPGELLVEVIDSPDPIQGGETD